jgi:hypothetical protein
VNLDRRLARLEAAYPDDRPADDGRDEWGKVTRALTRIERLLGEGDAGDPEAVLTRVLAAPRTPEPWRGLSAWETCLAWLAWQYQEARSLPPGPYAARRRWPEALVLFLDRTPPEWRGRVLTSGALWGRDADGGEGWLARWLRDVSQLRARLPADLDPAVMAALLSVYVDRSAERDSFFSRQLCVRCGLTRPAHKRPPLTEWRLLPGRQWGVGPPPWYDLPAFFPACPHCQEWQIEWPGQGPRVWLPQAEQELAAVLPGVPPGSAAPSSGGAGSA